MDEIRVPVGAGLRELVIDVVLDEDEDILFVRVPRCEHCGRRLENYRKGKRFCGTRCRVTSNRKNGVNHG